MGCGLRKLKPTAEENSPGKIYSTLKRPQVETKVGVAYTYRYLDFLIGKDGGTSTLRLSSVRELPGQLQELYQQGFILAAVHPFIHPCGPESNSPQHQLYRAILVQLNDGVERSQPVSAPYRLQLEECLSADQVPTPEHIQGYVKKQIQDAADQGVMFVGFVQEPYGAPCTRIREPETPSMSLHSSPSSVLGSLDSCSPSNPSSPRNKAEPLVQREAVDAGSPCEAGEGAQSEGKQTTVNTGDSAGTGVEEDTHSGASPPGSPSSAEDPGNNQELMADDSLTHNNNRANATGRKERSRYRTRRGDGVDLLSLFNHPTVREGQLKYYTIKVPLRVQNRDEGVKGVEANWLDHMTQHFNNGASLVDGYFHLGSENDVLPKSVESVFIFQEATEGEQSAANPTYDAIVVEQWTIIDGLQVKTDYVPLLQSLATYGWRLTCVLPTPVIKTNSDGSLSTKQIVFLQRPVLARKRRETKKLIFKPRNKSNKNCIKDVAKNKKKKNKAAAAEKEPEDPKILDDREPAAAKEQTIDKYDRAATTEAARDAPEATNGREEKTKVDGKVDDSVEVAGVQKNDGDAEIEEKGPDNCTTVEEDKSRPETEAASGGSQINGNVAVVVAGSAVVVDGGSEVGQEDVDGGVEKVEAVVENGLGPGEERQEDGESATDHPGPGEPANKGTVAKLAADARVTASNQSPAETQE